MAVEIVAGAVVLWIVPIFVANAIGGPKGRAGAAYGIFLGWLGVLVVALLPPLTAEQQLASLERDRNMLNAADYAKKRAAVETKLRPQHAYRECPFCKESMRADATVCPHCRHESATAEAVV